MRFSPLIVVSSLLCMVAAAVLPARNAGLDSDHNSTVGGTHSFLHSIPTGAASSYPGGNATPTHSAISRTAAPTDAHSHNHQSHSEAGASGHSAPIGPSGSYSRFASHGAQHTGAPLHSLPYRNSPSSVRRHPASASAGGPGNNGTQSPGNGHHGSNFTSASDHPITVTPGPTGLPTSDINA